MALTTRRIISLDEPKGCPACRFPSRKIEGDSAFRIVAVLLGRKFQNVMINIVDNKVDRGSVTSTSLLEPTCLLVSTERHVGSGNEIVVTFALEHACSIGNLQSACSICFLFPIPPPPPFFFPLSLPKLPRAWNRIALILCELSLHQS